MNLTQAMEKGWTLRRNPRAIPFWYEDDDTGKSIKFSATLIGKGQFTRAYLGADNWVYLVLNEDQLGDYSKAMLAALYQDEGALPHIPVLEEIGSREIRGTDYRVYRSPLYKAPLRKKDSPKAWALYQQLKKADKKADGKIGWNQRKGCFWGYRFNTHVIDELEAMKPPKGITKKGYQTFIESMELLRDNIANYGSEYKFEFPARNLATDGKGQLILLDVLFSIENLRKKFGGHC